MNISKLSSEICQRLNHINQKSLEENVIIEYGMALFLENVSKLLLILAIGFLIGEGKESFIILFTFCMFRLQAGGRHAKNNIGCTLSMLFIWGLSLIASRYVTIGIPALVCIFIIGIAAVLLWVPQSINIGYFTSEATAVSATIARKKVYSFLFLCCSLIVAVIFGSIRMLIVSPIILEILTLIPNHNSLERSGKIEETTC